MSKCITVEKVTIPKEVAEAIELLRSKGYGNVNIFNHLRNSMSDSKAVAEAQLWVYRKEASNTLMEALVNGYDIERTPHEELRGYYESLNTTGWPSDAYVDSGRRNGIKETLRILGIKVEGVNVSCDE